MLTSGVYAGLSGFSHPSFIASRELRVPQGDTLCYQYGFDYVQRTIRLVLFGLGDAFKHWLGYYDNDHDRMVAEYSEITTRGTRKMPAESFAHGR